MAFPSGFRLIAGNYFKNGDRSGPYVIDPNGVASLVSSGTGSGGGGGSAPVATTQAVLTPVAVPDTTATQVIAAAAGRTRVMFRNTGSAALVLGPSGVTVDNAAIYLKNKTELFAQNFACGLAAYSETAPIAPALPRHQACFLDMGATIALTCRNNAVTDGHDTYAVAAFEL